MPKRINIKGVIVPNDDKWIYDLFEMESTCPNEVIKEIQNANGRELEIIINSGGGDVYSGSEIYTELKSYKGHSVVKIVGRAASAASVIAMGGKKTLISPTAQLMMHNVSSQARGDYRDLKHGSDVLKSYNKSIANSYMLKSGMDQDELLKLMDKETWFTAQEALERKLVDEIMFQDEGQARLVASSDNTKMIPTEVINKFRNELGNSSKADSSNKGSLEKPNNKGDEETMTLEELKEKHPELYNQIIEEGRKEGIENENKRIKAIEDLGVPGFDDLVAKAKFENKDSTAESLAMSIIKAQNSIGEEHLTNLKDDAKDLDDVKGDEAPEENNKEAKEKEGASLIAKFINKGRGGDK